MNVSGGCKSYRLKTAYSTLSRFASCAMVIVDPHPLPISPGAAAAAGVPGTAGVDRDRRRIERPSSRKVRRRLCREGGGKNGREPERDERGSRIGRQPCRDSMADTRAPAGVSRIRSSPQMTLPSKTF